MESHARYDSIPLGINGDVEKDVVKSVELKTWFSIENQNRLKAEGNNGTWDTTGLTVHSDVMLKVEFMEMDINLSYQGFTAMLALIRVRVHPEWVKRELMLSSEHSTELTTRR